MNAARNTAGGWRVRVLTDAQEDDVARLYRGHASTRQLAKQFGVSATTIRNVLKRRGVTPRPIGRPPGDQKLTPEQETQVVEDFRAGLPVADIASTFGLTRSRVRTIRRRHGLPDRRQVPPPGQKHILTDAQDDEVARLYRAGAKNQELAEQFGVGEKAIRSALKRCGVTPRPRGPVPGSRAIAGDGDRGR